MPLSKKFLYFLLYHKTVVKSISYLFNLIVILSKIKFLYFKIFNLFFIKLYKNLIEIAVFIKLNHKKLFIIFIKAIKFVRD